jgi:predicted acyl esterase
MALARSSLSKKAVSRVCHARRIPMIGRRQNSIYALMTLIVIVFFAKAASSELQKVSTPFEYSGYTHPEYSSFTTSSARVMMSDGVKLAVDIHLPSGGPATESFPVILEYLPYQRSTIDPVSGEIKDATTSEEGRFFLSHGYAFVRADMRGTGASTGWIMDFMPRLAKDGEQIINWIACQSWCNGSVGMMGSSYLGWAQTAAGEHALRSLKCITPECIPLDGYSGEAYPGGIYLDGFFKSFCEYMRLINLNYYLPNKGIHPAKPVIDEDGDGDLKDEIPIDANKDGSVLDDITPPKYPDGKDRIGEYLVATISHQKGNYDFGEWSSKCPFIDSPTPLHVNMYELSPSMHLAGLARNKIPIYNFGGWCDAFTRGTFELYCTLAKTNPSKVIIGPSYHDFPSGPLWNAFGVPSDKAEEMYLVEHLRFFDRYLKGVENGIDNELPVYIYVMNGAGWRFEKEWPLARQQVSRFYLNANGALTDVPSREGQDSYTADFTHNSSYGAKNGNRYMGIVGQTPDGFSIRTEKDKQCLTHTSAPFNSDTEVTGHPIAQLSVSSTADDGDFFVYLEDVNEKGEAVLVSEGQLRAGFKGLYNNNDIVRAGRTSMNVLPELPWHGFRQEQYDPKVFANDAVINLVIDLQPTSWVFKKGHSVRLSVACADYPTFRLHPTLSPQNNPDAPDNVIPTITVFHNALSESYVELPIIPKAIKE